MRSAGSKEAERDRALLQLVAKGGQRVVGPDVAGLRPDGGKNALKRGIGLAGGGAGGAGGDPVGKGGGVGAEEGVAQGQGRLGGEGGSRQQDQQDRRAQGHGHKLLYAYIVELSTFADQKRCGRCDS